MPNHKHFYNSKGWKQGRLAHLAEHPLCVYCQQQGKITAANVVDHIIPHEGDEALFFDTENWQSLCKPHHDSTKQSMERGGSRTYAIGADGLPIDRNHPFYG